MEWLQAAQYYVINDCASNTNKILTLIGVAHILFQPFMIHKMSEAFLKTDVDRAKNQVYQKLALFGAFFLFILFNFLHSSF